MASTTIKRQQEGEAARRAAKAGLSKNQSKKAAKRLPRVTKEGRKCSNGCYESQTAERFDKASGIALKTTIGAGRVCYVARRNGTNNFDGSWRSRTIQQNTNSFFFFVRWCSRCNS